MRAGAAEAQCPPGTVFAIILVDQIVTMHVADVGLVEFLLIIMAAHQMKCRIVGIIIYTVIMKRDQHSLVDRLFKRNLIRDVVIAELINAPAVHPFGRGSKPQHKLRLEILYDSSVLVCHCMMEFIHHNIVKVFRLEILLIQISYIPQRCNRGKDHRLVCALLCTVEEAVVIAVSHIFKRLCGLLQDLFSVCNKENSLIIPGIKCSQVCFADTGCRLHQTLYGTF